MAQPTNTNEPMKIYTITPAFEEKHLARNRDFFETGHEYLQLRDKNADFETTCRFAEQVQKVAENYAHAKIILNGSNNFEVNGQTVLNRFDFTGVQQQTRGDKGSEHYCPKSRFNFLSCHSKTDIGFAYAAGFKAVTLSPVFYTLTHPEKTETIGIEEFSMICSTSRLPVFALGGINLDMVDQFCDIKGCAGIAMIRGWFSD